jgi:serine/threonine protein kinase/formylglycine-generating enzyme required for sulfatase activity
MAVSLEQFVERLEASGLMSADEVAAATNKLPDDRQPKDVKSLAKHLVKQGKLTKYQAAAVYQERTDHLVVGDYVVLDKLGEGGMGEVLKAQHRRMDRIVALKILPAAKVDSKDAIDRFHQEVRAAAKLTHPNIVTAYDAGEQDGLHYLVMEYVEGKDLSSILREQGRLPVEEAVDCVVQAATGLGYAHEMEVVHRDIKPANLLLSNAGVVKILDMGLARLTGGSDLNKAGGAGEGLTQSGQVMGTVDYMAPEQALDTRRADERADIYALGCTLYRLVTGEVPYAGDTMMMKLLAHREQPVPSLREYRPEVSPALDAVYQRMMIKDPDARQQSMAEVVGQLQTALVSRAAPAAARPAAGSAVPREPEEPSMDSALSEFLQEKPQSSVSAQPSTEQSAFEETINRGASEEGTGERLEEVEPVAVGALGAEQASAESALETREHSRDAKSTRKPWLIPAIVGGAVCLVVLVGLIFAFALRGDKEIGLAGNDPPDSSGAPPGQMPATEPRKKPDTAAVERLPQPAPPTTPNTNVVSTRPPVPAPPSDYGPGAPPPAVAPFDEKQAKEHQRAWADFLGVPVRKEVHLRGGATMIFTLIPPGEFMMGPWSSPSMQRRVILTRPFYLGAHEVTKRQFADVMNKGNSDSNHAVGMVVWPQAVIFCNKLSDHEKRQPCYKIDGRDAALTADGDGFRLPTEAEWEFACRAGTTTAWYFGDDPSDADKHAWFGNNSGRTTHPVGQKLPNQFGLYDMIGNHWEWCYDRYAEWPPAAQVLRDPVGPDIGNERVERGRFWVSPVDDLKSGHRHKNNPNMTYPAGGFRVVMPIPESVWLNRVNFPQTTERARWTSLFNGRDLTGWDGDPNVWSVEDGVIIGRTTPQNPIQGNTFLIWQGGEVGDFELQAKFRIESGNSGIQFRSKDLGKWVMSGYQADFDAQKTEFLGGLYHEKGRRMLAKPQVPISQVFKSNDWNNYHIIARGNRIIQKINGVTTVDFVDNDPAANSSGLIGLQVHGGPPMKVQFKDVVLRRLDDSKEGGGGYALEFDGTASHVKLPTLQFDGTHPLTIETIIESESDLSQSGHIVSDVESSGVGLLLQDNHWQFVARTTDGYVKAKAPAASGRHHLAGVYTGDRVLLFVDGKLRSEVPVPTKVAPSGIPFVIGANPGENSGASDESKTGDNSFYQFFRGTIEEVRISKAARYSTNFTPSVQATDADTLALYQFDEGSGATLVDSSGHGHHGTIHRAKWVRVGLPSLNQGLIAHWKFDETDGDVARDASGNGHDGKIAGATREKGRLGGALKFDGVDDYVSYPAMGTANSFSYAMWVNMPDGLPRKEFTGLILDDGWEKRDQHMHFVFQKAGSLGLYLWLADLGDRAYGARGLYKLTEILSSGWVHVGVTFNQATSAVSFYVNGKKYVGGDVPGQFSPSFGPGRIGAWNTEGVGYEFSDRFFRGLVDDVRIYNRALTATDFKALSSANLPTTSAIDDDPITPPGVKLSILPADDLVEVSKLIDLERDVVSGDWKRDGDVLKVSASEDDYSRLLLPVVPKGSYLIEYHMTRAKGTGDIAMLLPVGDRSVVLHTSAFGKWAGIDMIGGAGVHKSDNPTRAASPVTTGKPVKVQVAVMKQDNDAVRFVIQIDGKKLSDVAVPIADLGEHTQWHADLADKTRLGIGAHDSETVIDYVKLKMLDGEAEILGPERESVAIKSTSPEPIPTRPVPKRDEWVTLFNGRDLTGWQPVGDANLWSATDGAIVASGNGVGWLSTENEYANFVLQFEYRLPARGNSGVFLRAPRAGKINGGEFLEIQLIDDPSSGVNKNFTGAAYNIAKRKVIGAPFAAKTGKWNQMEISAAGPQIQVAVNGKLINQFDLTQVKIPAVTATNARRTRGFIGLQCNNTGVAFRNIRIRPARD